MMSTFNVSNILFYPILLLLGGGVAARTFVNLLLALKVYSSSYSSNAVVESIRPALKQLNVIAEHMFGKIHKEQIKLNHVLLAAILIVLLSILQALNAQQRTVERKDKK